MTSAPRRAAPCPRSGCDQWALLAGRPEIDLGGHVQSCLDGHRGPRILGLDAVEHGELG